MSTTPTGAEAASAIVTGAGSGIGRAVTLALAAAGDRVLAVDRNLESAEETAKLASGTVVAHRSDVSDPDQVAGYLAAALEQHGPPQKFFNNAGVEGVHRSIEETSVEDWLAVTAVNLHGVFYGLKHVLPVMRARGGGAIVNTGSILSLKAAADRSDYVTTKHAVLGLTRSAAAEGAPHGIRVNCICPGPIDTPLMSRSEVLVNPDDPAFERDRFVSGTPVGRYGTPVEIAELVLHLLRPDLGYHTGSAIAIDGGITAV